MKKVLTRLSPILGIRLLRILNPLNLHSDIRSLSDRILRIRDSMQK